MISSRCRLCAIVRETPHLIRALHAARALDPSDWLIAAGAIRDAVWVATFPETASCVAVRLLADDGLLVVAPYGLGDLFACVCRRNPTRVSASFYAQRVQQKGWRARWPKMRYGP